MDQGNSTISIRELVATSSPSPTLQPVQLYAAPGAPTETNHPYGLPVTLMTPLDEPDEIMPHNVTTQTGETDDSRPANLATHREGADDVHLAIAGQNGPHLRHDEQRNHRGLFLVALERMHGHEWANPWDGNYEIPGPSEVENVFRHQALVPQGFTPTRMALYGAGVQRERTEWETIMAMVTDMSDNYLGDPGNPYNYSVPDLPDHLNTAFWITGFPPNVTVAEILGAIHGCGRIYAIHINRERAYELGHAACKLVFFDVLGSTTFYNTYATNQTLTVRGRRARIVRNRHKVPEQLGLPHSHSRCIRVTGPRHVVNMPFLIRFFHQFFKYQLDRVFNWFLDDISSIELRFGSYRAQAIVATIIIRNSWIFRANGVMVEYTEDPCDTPRNFAQAQLGL